MKLFLLLNLIIFSFSGYAQRAKVLIIDPELKTKGLENYDLQRPHYGRRLPPKELRDEILSGIESVKKWDELKKDIFFMDLKSKKLSELKKKYPEVSDQEFDTLMERK